MVNKLRLDGRLLFGLLVVLALACAPGAARAFETLAKAAILVDHDTGQVLFAKNADEAAAAGLDEQADDRPHAVRAPARRPAEARR